MDLYSYIRDVPDFPKPGIVFKDISPLLAAPEALKACIDRMIEAVRGLEIDRVAGIESRGFLFGVPIATALGKGFVPVRKAGKLPWKTHAIEYALEYGNDTLEIHVDGVHAGERILLVDDLLATGGTMKATCDLVEGIGASVADCAFAIELAFLGGRAALGERPVEAVLTYD